MWGGPQNPRGSYSFPTHYFDGTAIHDEDFSELTYPNNQSSTSYSSTSRHLYGAKEYFIMTPSSMSCSSTILPANYYVWRHTGYGENANAERPVVCKGTEIKHFRKKCPQLNWPIFRYIDFQYHERFCLHRQTMHSGLCFRRIVNNLCWSN